jgi:hypothetical protein
VGCMNQGATGPDVASALVLVTTDPGTGRSRIGSTESDALVGGAFLIDLIAAGRVVLEGKGRKAKVVVVDSTPVPGGPLQVAFTRLQAKGPLRPQDAVVRLGKRGKSAVYASLAAQGLVRARTKGWGVLSVTRHDVTSPERAALVGAVRRVLLEDAPADATTGPLVGLLHAGKLLKVVVDGPDRKRARKRAEVVSQGDWASAGVRDAIKAAQSAVAVVAVTAATAGAAGGGGS